jgi:hypothetical protein
VPSIRGGRLFVEDCAADAPIKANFALATRWILSQYQDGLASNFNALPRPGMVLVNGDQAEWIKLPETVADVFMRDLVPERLRAAK